MTLVGAVSYGSGRPELVTADGGLPLLVEKRPGESRLGWRVQDSRRHCLGHARIDARRAAVQTTPCPKSALAERGDQCLDCFIADEFRPIHDSHRGGEVPVPLRSYLAREHWLYIASFAHGVSKVGTTSDASKASRLAEQGAVASQFVARARNGSIIRVLEDAVSTQLELPQVVRKAAKTAGLTRPWSLCAVQETNDGAAAAARAALSGMAIDGFSIVQESPQPASANPWIDALGTASPAAYPLDLALGDHGFTVGALLGQNALVWVAGEQFVLDFSALKGRLVDFGDYYSQLPATQTALF